MKNKIIIVAAVLLGVLLSANFAAAQSCPSLTSVDGTAVTFVGELTDTGGDSYTLAWFEYGKTRSYGQKTSEQTLTETGLYCTTVSNLSPCTTYNYRAVAKNTAGTSYGENKTFTTTCDSTTVSLKANGYDSSVTIPYNNSADLSWTSYNANYCSASGDWSGTKSLSGSQTTGALTSSKTYTIACTGPAGSISDSVTVNVSGQTYNSPSVNIRANGYDGYITIPYNDSVNLSWTSDNANYCYASGDWSGTKNLNSSQTTGTLTSSKTYTITCSGSGGSVSDSVTVNVSTQTYADFSVNKTVRNLSKGTFYLESVNAEPGEVLNFRIAVKAGSDPLYSLVVRDTLPSGLVYVGDLRVDNVLTSGNILTGLNIGSLSAYQEKVVTFRADVAGSESFTFGQTQLTNTASVTSGSVSRSNSVSSGSVSRSDIATVSVTRAVVAGAATAVSTGLTNNIFLDSFFLPLMISLLIVWLLKSRIIKFEEWLDLRKKEYQIYKSKKILQLKIAKIKTRELFQRII